MSGIKIIEVNGKISIDSPYNPDFVKRIKVAGGKWNPDTKQWTMDARSIETAREILREIYGEDDRGGDKVTVRVTIGKEDYNTACGPAVILGRVIARAQGRDTGAKVGDGVSFVKGAPTSGGSMKYWKTVLPAGSIFEIYDVPAVAVETALASQNEAMYTVEAVDMNAPDIEALKAERERLAARIAEIDAIINKN